MIFYHFYHGIMLQIFEFLISILIRPFSVPTHIISSLSSFNKEVIFKLDNLGPSIFKSLKPYNTICIPIYNI